MEPKKYALETPSSRLTRWSIVGIGSFQTFLLIGIPRLSGIFYVESMSRYNVNRKEASFPYLLFFTLKYTSGPLHGYLCRKYGLRFVTALGGLLCFIGAAGCFFAQEIITVSILWGVVFGTGSGMGTSLLPVVFKWHFGDKSSKANALCMLGSPLGAVVFPGILDFLVRIYGLSGTFLIISGLILNSIPVVVFFKKPRNMSEVIAANEDDKHSFSNEKQSKATDGCNEISTSSTPHSVGVQSNKDNMDTFPTQERNTTHEAHIPQFSESKNSRFSDAVSVVKETNLKSTVIPLTYKSPYLDKKHNFSCTFSESKLPALHKMQKATKSNYNVFRVFMDATFMVIMMTQSMLYVISVVLWTVILDHGRDCGVLPSQEVYLLSVLPGTSVVGCLFHGWIIDGGYVSPMTFTAGAFICLGVSFALMAVAGGFIVLITASVLFGLMASGISVVQPSIVQEFIEKRDFTMAMAARLTLFGPLNLVMPFIIGYFRGTMGSYSELLFIFAALSGVCAVLTWVTPYLSRRRKTQDVT